MYFYKKKLSIAITTIVCLNSQAVALQIPPGFGELAKSQLIWLDVSLYGESLGLYQADVDLEKVRFLHPEKLIRAISKRYDDTSALKSVLETGLSRSLARNDNMSCSTGGNRPGCDYINTKSAAIIYDENDARANLFLPSQFIPKEKTDAAYFRNASDSHNGFIHQQNLNFVADRDYQSVSVQGNGTQGLTKNGYANVDWTYIGQRYRSDSNNLLDVNNAYVRQDMWKKIYLQAGQMDSRDIFSSAGGSLNLSQLPIGRIRGVRIGSTQAWVNQEKVVRGTPVTVFLSRESRVDVYRDNRLLQSFYLSAGAQQLDTQGFPSGSYTVTLQIYEDNQLVRTQTVPYSSIGVAPDRTFQWFMQAGKLVDNSTVRTNDNHQVVLGGVRIPITASLALTAGATVLNTASYQEGALDWSHGFDSGPLLDGVMTARASYMHGSDGSAGNIQQVSYNDGFSLSYYRSAMTSPDCNGQGEKRYSYSGCYKSSNIMFSVQVLETLVMLGYSTSQNEGRYVYRSQLPEDDREHNAGVPWDQMYTTRSRSRAWQAGINKSFTWNGLNINTSLNAFIRHDNSYSGTDKGGSATISLFRTGRSGTDNPGSSSLSSTWSNSRRNGDELGYNGSYSRYLDNSGDNELGASVSGVNTRDVSTQAFGRYGGQYGRSSLTLSDAWDRQYGQHTFSASGNYTSSLVIDRNGFYWGRWGDGMPSSAVTVGVDAGDDDKTSRVNVSVDYAGQADIRGNSRAVFTVPGYQQSTVSFSEVTDSSQGISSEISRGAGSRTLFMAPGKVFNRDVSISTRYTWLGKMTDAADRPLEDAIPLNVMSWSPLGSGGFSLETTHPLKSLYVMRGDEYLQCPVQVKSKRDVVRWVGTVRCESIAFARLPESEKQQAELMTAGLRKNDDDTTAMNEE